MLSLSEKTTSLVLKGADETLCITILLRIIRNCEIALNTAIRAEFRKKKNRTILTTIITVNLLEFEILTKKRCITIKNELPETSLSVGVAC